MSATPQAGASEARSTLQDLTTLKPRVSHVAYHVADIERALAFYKGVLGLQEQLRLPLGGGLQEVILGFPNAQGAGVILMWNTEQPAAREHGNGYSRFVLNVSDIDAAMTHLLAHDVPVVTPISSVGAMKYAMVKDPDGYVIELLQFIRS
jgi:catechol 2,3-dioxygenase-like lactoylglutathione lyase family enzyme